MRQVELWLLKAFLTKMDLLSIFVNSTHWPASIVRVLLVIQLSLVEYLIVFHWVPLFRLLDLQVWTLPCYKMHLLTGAIMGYYDVMSSTVFIPLPFPPLYCRRTVGAVIYIAIVYSNLKLFGDIEYTYQVSSEPDSTFRASTTMNYVAGDGRRRMDLVGTRVVISHTGTVSVFNLFALLINLAVG